MSAIIAGLLPKIEGFQPIPNAVMIPFMEAQSAALAYGFGLNYEYGKRKIRSMSNDEFNKLTSLEITQMSNNHTHIILSKFQAMVPLVMPMQHEIFRQYVAIEKAKVVQNVELAKWVVNFAKTGIDELLVDQIAHLTGQHTHQDLEKDFLPNADQPAYDPTADNQNAPTTADRTTDLAKLNQDQYNLNILYKNLANATTTRSKDLIKESIRRQDELLANSIRAFTAIHGQPTPVYKTVNGITGTYFE